MDEMCCLDSISSGNELILVLLLILACGIIKHGCDLLNWIAVYFSLVATIYFGLRYILALKFNVLKN